VSAVEFSTGRGTEKQSVSVTKEAILSGGAFGSPQILQLSGVGPRDVLGAANVTVQLELPGVGQHLMDHLTVPVYFNTSADTAGSIHASDSDLSKSPVFNSYVNDAIAYINGSRLFDGDTPFATFRDQIAWELAHPSTSRIPSTSSEVIEGYKTIYQATLEKIYPTVGIVEFLFSINAAGTIAIQTALQQGFSQGRMYITSPSVYDSPSIDPQCLSHPADIVVLRQGFKLARVVAGTPPLSSVLTGETQPGSQVQSDDDIETYIRNTVASEFHPCGTCAMLPREKGGVVDARFRVYSVKNLRVVDSSVFPVSFSAHLMAPTYALAEKAAELILDDWNGGTATGTGVTSTKSSAYGMKEKLGCLRVFLPLVVILGLF
jgi:choline dehydrogenase